MSDHLNAEQTPRAGADTSGGSGDQAVDSVLVELTCLADLSVDEHLGVYDSIHERLRNHLVTVDAGEAGEIPAASSRPVAAPEGGG